MPSGINDAAAVFRKFDVNGDGKISYEELSSVLQELNPLVFCDDRFVKLLSMEVDTDDDGYIDYNEFVQWITKDSEVAAAARRIEDDFGLANATCKPSTALVPTVVGMDDRAARAMADDEAMAKEQLEKAHAKPRPHVTPSVVDQLGIVQCFQKFDENGDGVISFVELANVLRELNPFVFDDATFGVVDGQSSSLGGHKFGGHGHSEAFLEMIRQEVDTDDNGYVDYDEFVQWIMDDASTSAPQVVDLQLKELRTQAAEAEKQVRESEEDVKRQFPNIENVLRRIDEVPALHFIDSIGVVVELKWEIQYQAKPGLEMVTNRIKKNQWPHLDLSAKYNYDEETDSYKYVKQVTARSELQSFDFDEESNSYKCGEVSGSFSWPDDLVAARSSAAPFFSLREELEKALQSLRTKEGELEAHNVALAKLQGNIGLLAPFAAAPRKGPKAMVSDAEVNEWAADKMAEVNALANSVPLIKLRRDAADKGLSKNGGKMAIAKRLLYYEQEA